MRPDPKIDHLRSALLMHVATSIARLNQWATDLRTGGVHVPARSIIERGTERAQWLIDFCIPITTEEERQTMRKDLAVAASTVSVLLKARTQDRVAVRNSRIVKAL